MAYNKTLWQNNSLPAINAGNLNKIEQGIYEAHNNIGDLSNLDTTNKDNLVEAINEAKLEHYSTTETVVGKWIDGKPIYRKVFSFNLGSTINTWSTIGTIANIKLPIRFYGICWNVDATFDIPRAFGGEDIALYCDTSSKLFREQHNYSYANNLPAFAVIEYTKTTD